MQASNRRRTERMKIYETPVLVVSELTASDIITVSGGDTPVTDWEW